MNRTEGFFKRITMRLQQSVMKKKINKPSNSERFLCTSVIAVFRRRLLAVVEFVRGREQSRENYFN